MEIPAWAQSDFYLVSICLKGGLCGSVEADVMSVVLRRFGELEDVLYPESTEGMTLQQQNG